MTQHSSATSRRSFLRNVSAGVLSAAALPAIWADDKSGKRPLLLGHGEHTYECTHDWLTPPPRIRYGDTHGLARDEQGRIYVGHTVHESSESGDAVVVFDADGKFIESWGAAFRGGSHGLDIRAESGQEFLYHCDIRRRLLVKTDLRGKLIWQAGYPRESGVYPSEDKYCPTNVAFLPDGDLLVGDGYGSSYIHRYSADGEYRATIIKPGADAGQVNCPHGLWIDPRGGRTRLAVADRGNRRIQYFSLDGTHLGFVTEGIRMPCHFKLRGELMLVPDLESVVTLLDGENKVVAQLGDGHPSKLRGAAREQYIPGKFIHPHAAIFLERDLLVAEWVPTGRITHLRRVS